MRVPVNVPSALATAWPIGSVAAKVSRPLSLSPPSVSGISVGVAVSVPSGDLPRRRRWCPRRGVRPPPRAASQPVPYSAVSDDEAAGLPGEPDIGCRSRNRCMARFREITPQSGRSGRRVTGLSRAGRTTLHGRVRSPPAPRPMGLQRSVWCWRRARWSRSRRFARSRWRTPRGAGSWIVGACGRSRRCRPSITISCLSSATTFGGRSSGIGIAYG